MAAFVSDENTFEVSLSLALASLKLFEFQLPMFVFSDLVQR